MDTAQNNSAMADHALPSRPVLFFDIDNTLYPKGKKVHDMMQELIDIYFIQNLAMSEEEAKMLHRKYYIDYGLAIEGLVRHHKVNALDFNRKVDDALPLDGVITQDPELRKLLEDFDRTKIKLWLFTNAHVTHAKRVVRLLGIEDLFEGITYCDYTKEKLLCKPHKEMYDKAEAEAGAASASECFFVDDNYTNCKQAHSRGWTTVHLREPGALELVDKSSDHQILALDELRTIWPHFFKKDSVADNAKHSQL